MTTSHNAAMLHGFKLPQAFEHAVLMQLQQEQIIAASHCNGKLWVNTQSGGTHEYVIRLH